jgi:hypothetical protein
MYMYYICFIHSLVDRHLGWLHSLNIMNSASINMGVLVYLLYAGLLPKYFIFWGYCEWYCFPDFLVCSLLVLRKDTGSCILSLYPANLLNVFMKFKRFLIEFLGSVRLRSYHLQIEIFWLLLFESLLFLSPALLFWIEILLLYWKKRG